jgi:hypothetical protein
MRIPTIFAVLSSVLFFYFVTLALSLIINTEYVFTGNLIFKSVIVLAFAFFSVTKKEFLNKDSNGKFGVTGVIMGFGCVIFLLLAAQNLVFLVAMFLYLFIGTYFVCVGEKN